MSGLWDSLTKAFGITDDSKPAQPTGGGLWNALEGYLTKAKPSQGVKPGAQKFSLTGFVDTLAELEGTEDHQGQEQGGGEVTYGYGVLPSTAKRFGVDYKPDSNRRDNALAVYSKMLDEFKSKHADINLDEMEAPKANAIMSAYINLGSFDKTPGLAEAIKNGNSQTIATSLLSVHNFKRDGQTFSSKGLVARQAKAFNMLQKQSGQEDSQVAEIAVSGTREKPVFLLKTSAGSTIAAVPAKYPLATSNSMRSIKLKV